MEPYERFLELLSAEDREGAISHALGLLEQGDVDVVELYEAILGPALKDMSSQNFEKKWNIWKEHMRTSIVRTIIEMLFIPTSQKSRRRSKGEGEGVVVLACPTRMPSIGIRMVADLCSPWQAMIRAMSGRRPYWTILSAVNTPPGSWG